MKQLISIFLLAVASSVQAQYSPKPDTAAVKKTNGQAAGVINPVSTNIPLVSGVTTGIRPQPTAIPSNNQNPTTGTIINMEKSKEERKAVNPLGTAALETQPAIVSSDTLLSNQGNTPPAKKKKNRERE